MTTFDANHIPMHDFISPKRILVATDLTDGEYLIPHAVAQAKTCGAMVTLIHAILPLEAMPLDAGAVAYADWEKTERETLESLSEMAAQIEAYGVSCDVTAKHGQAADVVQEEIRTTHATRLIMASHGRGRWGQFVMGSVANQLLGNVSIPIFVVGPKSAGFPEHAKPRRILHPVSLNGDYRLGVELAAGLAREFRAELTLLHVPDRDVEASIHPGCTLSWAENLFARLFPNDDLELETSVKINVAFGKLPEEIRKAAISTSADWIVMGVQDGLPLWPILESTAYKVLAGANCPVLAFRREPLHFECAMASQEHSLVGIA